MSVYRGIERVSRLIPRFFEKNFFNIDTKNTLS